MRCLALFLSLALCLPLAAAKPAAVTNQYVAADARLLAKPSAFAKVLKTLKKGTLVKAEKPKNGYVKVTVALGEDSHSGYLPMRAVQKSKPKLTTAARRSSDASAEEVAAATKGFNKQVEASLRAGKAEDGFVKLDQALERTQMDDPAARLEGFRESGKLGEFKEGGE